MTALTPEQPQRMAPVAARGWASFTLILTAVWFAGAILSFAWKLLAYRRHTATLLRGAVCAPEADGLLYQALCEKCGVRRAPALLVSGEAPSPLLCGFCKPQILLPAIGLSQNALVGILAHELTHFRRRDLWVKLLCVAATSLHWWNPLVHAAAKRCNAEMELSCDEAVLAGLDEEARRSYGKVVLDMIRRCGRTRGVLTTQFNPGKNAVKERFCGIMDMTEKKRGAGIAAVAAVVLLCAAAGGLIGCRIAGAPEDGTPSADTPRETVVSTLPPATGGATEPPETGGEAPDVNLDRDSFDAEAVGTLLPNENAQLLFYLKAPDACYFFCSIRTRTGDGTAYTDDWPVDFAVYYQDYVTPLWYCLDAPLPDGCEYDSVLPAAAFTASGDDGLCFVLRLTKSGETFYLQYVMAQGVYRPLSAEEAGSLIALYAGVK